jgi:hypothetical protein
MDGWVNLGPMTFNAIHAAGFSLKACQHLPDGRTQMFFERTPGSNFNPAIVLISVFMLQGGQIQSVSGT